MCYGGLQFKGFRFLGFRVKGACSGGSKIRIIRIIVLGAGHCFLGNAPVWCCKGEEAGIARGAPRWHGAVRLIQFSVKG